MWELFADAGPSASGSGDSQGVVITLIAAGSGIALAVVNGFYSGRKKNPSDNKNKALVIPDKLATTAAESTIENTLSAYDRLIGSPLRAELAEVRNDLEACVASSNKIQTELAIKNSDLVRERKEKSKYRDDLDALQSEYRELMHSFSQLMQDRAKKDGPL